MVVSLLGGAGRFAQLDRSETAPAVTSACATALLLRNASTLTNRFPIYSEDGDGCIKNNVSFLRYFFLLVFFVY